MIMNLYAIMDTAAEELGPPFQAKNDATARRQYQELQKKSPFPEDFLLVYLGKYETTTVGEELSESGIIPDGSAPRIVDPKLSEDPV